MNQRNHGYQWVVTDASWFTNENWRHWVRDTVSKAFSSGFALHCGSVGPRLPSSLHLFYRNFFFCHSPSVPRTWSRRRLFFKVLNLEPKPTKQTVNLPPAWENQNKNPLQYAAMLKSSRLMIRSLFPSFSSVARGYPWTPRNRRPEKLRDSLKELEVPAPSLPSSPPSSPAPPLSFLPLGILGVFPFQNGRLINK